VWADLRADVSRPIDSRSARALSKASCSTAAAAAASEEASWLDARRTSSSDLVEVISDSREVICD